MPPRSLRSLSRSLAALFAVGSLCASRVAHADVTEQCVASAEAAQDLIDRGRYAAAREHLAQCAREQCPAAVRKDCLDWLADLKKLQPSVVFAAKGAGGDDLANVRVTEGGREITTRLEGQPIALDPGSHDLVFETPGRPRIVEIRWSEGPAPARAGGEDRAASHTGNAGGRGRSVMPFVLGGVSLAAFTTSGVLALTAKSSISSVESSPCAATKTCEPDVLDDARGRLVAADVALGIGIASLAVAVVWAVIDWGSHSGSASTVTSSR
jgi:hypothetical protein